MGVWAERNSTAQLLFHPFRFQTLYNDWSLYSFSGFSRQTGTITFNHDIICTSARRRGWLRSFLESFLTNINNGTLWLFCHCTVSPLKPSNLPNVCGWVEGLSQSQKKNLQLLIKFCLLFRVFFFQFVRLPFFLLCLEDFYYNFNRYPSYRATCREQNTQSGCREMITYIRFSWKSPQMLTKDKHPWSSFMLKDNVTNQRHEVFGRNRRRFLRVYWLDK